MLKKLCGFLTTALVVMSLATTAFAEPVLQEGKVNPDYIKYWNMSKEERANTLVPRSTIPSYSDSSLQKQHSLLKNTTLPTKFNLVDSNDVTSVKNQGSRGVCWTFSANAMLESHLLKKYDRTYDFSELHMDYASSMYCPNGQTYTEGTTNPLGFNKNAGVGGNILLSSPYLFRAQGVVNESEMPYNAQSGRVALSSVTNAKSSGIWVRDYVVYPSQSAANGTMDMGDYRKIVKQHLMNNGALDITMNGGTSFTNSTVAFYDKDNVVSKADHAVTLVGWDDTYSKDNFTPDKPQSNGAWIIKNSWGTGVNNNGYFYMSYEDMTMYQVNAGVLNVSLSKNYDTMYSHDDFGYSRTLGSNSENTMYAMNVFDAKEYGEQLTSVTIGFYQGASYQVYVNPDGGSDFNISAENAQPVASGTFDYEGYKTVDLATPVTLNGGKFAVVVKYTMPGNAVWLGVEAKDDALYANVKANSGESYYSFNGSTWNGLTSNSKPANFCIKAYTKKSTITPDFTLTSLSVPQKINVGQTATLKAGVNSNVPNLKYKFSYKLNNGTSVDVANSTNSTASFKVPSAGTYTVTVEVTGPNNVVKSQSATMVAGDPNNFSVASVTAPTVSWVGQTVTIKPNVSGNTYGLTYKYVWSCDNWKTWDVIKDFSSATSMTYKLPKAGNFDFYVDIKATNGKQISKSARCVVKPATYFSLNSVNATGTFKVGNKVNINANVGGNTSGLQYKFVWSYNNWQKWGVIQDFSATNSASWTLQYGGKYDFYVDVRRPGVSTQSLCKTITSAEAFTCTGVSAPKSSLVGNSATITPTISGTPTGATFKYVWSLNNWEKWGVIKDFSTARSVTTTLKHPGKYDFYVDVKLSNGKVITHQATANVNLRWTVNGVTLSKSTIKLGESVKLTANMTNGSASMRYKFVWNKNNWSSWDVIRDYNTTNNAVFKPTSRGKYEIYMDVMDSYGNVKTVTKVLTVV